MNFAPAGPPEENWQKQILQKVSRSFALTIPQLPAGLSERVANAYLLCRIIDTIEDEENISLAAKRFFFDEFIAVIEGKSSTEAFVSGLHPLLGHNALPAERELVLGTPYVLQSFFLFTARQQSIIKRCLNIMASGMLRFQQLKNPSGLPDVAHMDAYCYHVAGVVGEMLTELFCDYSDETAKNRSYLLHQAPSFGQGLQMTNILKDFWEDRERGACWLPRDLFEQSGCELKNIKKGIYTPQFGKALTELIGIAHRHLKNALAYTLWIPRSESGMRKFCLWAIGMAIATLQNIYRQQHYGCAEEVKITRRKLKTIILVSNMALRFDRLPQSLFQFAARGLPLRPAAEPYAGGALPIIH